ncbi:MAG: phosphoglucosamine mutase [Ignavibacteria bacterium]|nr:phosphoglucosamine mutase [Ignavibacteria bacterium]
MPELIVSVSGIRGIPGESLTPQGLVRYVSAFAEYTKRNSRRKKVKVVVGRDGRLGGDVIENFVSSCLQIAGIEVTSIGTAPTPTVQVACELMGADGAIAITASHNPQEWNGLKFLKSDGTFLDGSQVEELISIAGKGEFSYARVNSIPGLKRDDGFIARHISKTMDLKLVDKQKIKKRKFKIVVDAVNSSGSVIVPALLRMLGCEVVELYCDGSGIFPHTPEPLPHNLKGLSKAVREHRADLGIAVDPDADRLVLITDEGKPFGEENTITASVRYVLRKYKGGNATVNLSTTRAVDDVAAEYGGRVFRSAVGEINVVKEMMKNGSVIGGEGSGGVILPESHYGRDSLAGIVLVLSELAASGLTAGEYKKSLPQYHITKGKIENVRDADKVLKALRQKFGSEKENVRLTTIDGLKLDFARHWIHLRRSNTEPIIRIITEAESRSEAERIQMSFTELVNEITG